MSIAQIFDQTAPLVSGYSMRSKSITDSLHQLGVPLRVYSSPIFTYKAAQEEQEGVPYVHSVMPKFETIRKFPILRELFIINTLKKTILHHWHDDIQLIDAHSSVLNGIVGSKIAQLKKLPFLYEIRAFWEDAAVDQGKTKEGSLRYNLTRTIETETINRANHITVICEGLKKDLLERGIAEDKITVIPNGVDIHEFQPQKVRDLQIEEKYGLKDMKVFGFIGTFFYFEGLELFIQAAKNILARRKDVKFLIVGGGQEEAKLKAMVIEKGMQGKVIFTGRVPHDQVAKYYSVIDVCVYPRISKRITELVTPLKPLEAMAMEKIVIGSDVGGIKELVTDGETGLLFQAGKFHDLADKCIYALENFAQMQQMARAGRRYVIAERNWLTICERYFDIFKKLNINISKKS